MKLHELRKELYDQMRLVRQDKANMGQAESMANLAGKAMKAIELEIGGEMMRAGGDKFRILDEILP